MKKYTLLLALLLSLGACKNEETKPEDAAATSAQTTQADSGKPAQAPPANRESDQIKEPELKKAVQALEVNQPATAVKVLDPYIKSHPKDLNAFNFRGVAHMRLGKQDLALKDFNQVIQLGPKWASGYFNRADLYLILKRPADAIKDFDKVLSLDPTFLPAYQRRAHLNFTQKKIDAAKKDLNQILKYTPNDADALNFLGYLEMQQKNYSQAIQSFDKALAVQPQLAIAMANKAQALHKSGKCPEALVWLKKSCAAGHRMGCQLEKQIKCQ